MKMHWFVILTSLSWCVIYGNCGIFVRTENEEVGASPRIMPVNCTDEKCTHYKSSTEEPEYYVSESEMDYDYLPNQDPDMATIHQSYCILLSESTVNKLEEIEMWHPDIPDVKHGVLEDLIQYMHMHATLKFENGDPALKLLDLVTLSASLLKSHYMVEGDNNCIYKNYVNFDLYSSQSFDKYDPEKYFSYVKYCVYLSSDAVSFFKDIERRYPDISVIRNKVFKELIFYMHLYATLEFENCDAEMKILDIIILAANFIKMSLMLQTDENLLYPCQRDNIREFVSNKKSKPAQRTTESFVFLKADESKADMTDSASHRGRIGELIEPSDCKSKSPQEKTESLSYLMTDESKSSTSSTTDTFLMNEKMIMRFCSRSLKEDQCRDIIDDIPESPCLGVSSVIEPPCKTTTKGVTEKFCQGNYKSIDHTCKITAEGASRKPFETVNMTENKNLHLSLYVSDLIKSISGIHYPNYTDIPDTTFSCADKKYVPGFYADVDTGCQVFHVCFKHRSESFLCPIGTTFNQRSLVCDYWHNSKCHLAPVYYDINKKNEVFKGNEINNIRLDSHFSEYTTAECSENGGNQRFKLRENDLDIISKFLPIKFKITEFDS